MLCPRRSLSEKHQEEGESSQAAISVHRPIPCEQTVMSAHGPSRAADAACGRERARCVRTASKAEAPGHFFGSGGAQARGMWSIEGKKSEGERSVAGIAASARRPRAGRAKGSLSRAVAWQALWHTVRSPRVGSQQPPPIGVDTCGCIMPAP